MVDKIVRIGIIGCSNVAKKSAIPAIKAVKDAKLISIASREVEKAKLWASENNIEFDNYDSLIERKDIDVVYISLPIGLHEEWAVRAAENGKHIICEKSLAESYTSVKRIVEVCRKNGVVLYENFMCGFHPQHQKVISLMKEGMIGKPLVLKGYFGFPPMNSSNFRYDKELGGGSLNDAGAYTVFIARKMLGEPIKVTSTFNMDKENEVDINGSAILEFADNKTALISFGFDNIYQNNYSIWGSKGKIKVHRAFSIPPNLKPMIELITNDGASEKITDIDILPANQFQLIFEDFFNTVINLDKVKINNIYAEILSQAKVMEALRISHKEDRKVNPDEID